MRRYALVGLGMILVFLALFALAHWLNIPLLVDPSDRLAEGSLAAAGLGVGLLIADVLLPIPSSLVMTAHGALFGIVGGTGLSLVGGTGAAAAAFWLGRRAGPALHRWVPAADQARADALLTRYGALAIILSRPLPLLAETVAIFAGTSPMRWRTLLLAALLGNLPPALLYAVTGATAAGLEDSVLVFGLVMAVAGGFWLVARRAS